MTIVCPPKPIVLHDSILLFSSWPPWSVRNPGLVLVTNIQHQPCISGVGRREPGAGNCPEHNCEQDCFRLNQHLTLGMPNAFNSAVTIMYSMSQIGIFGSFNYYFCASLAYSFLLLFMSVCSCGKDFRGGSMAELYKWILPGLAFGRPCFHLLQLPSTPQASALYNSEFF